MWLSGDARCIRSYWCCTAATECARGCSGDASRWACPCLQRRSPHTTTNMHLANGLIGKGHNRPAHLERLLLESAQPIT
jgi:hypothetical protein